MLLRKVIKLYIECGYPRMFSSENAILPSTEVILLGHPVLREKCMPVKLDQLKSQMYQTLFADLESVLKAKEAFGLSAPQLNRPFRVFAFRKYPLEDPHITMVINPHIVQQSQKLSKDEPEGCLSMPQYACFQQHLRYFRSYAGLVERPEEIVVEYFTKAGKPVKETLQGLAARIFQHELDHLDGVLYLDRMNSMRDLFHVDEMKRQLEVDQVEPVTEEDLFEAEEKDKPKNA